MMMANLLATNVDLELDEISRIEQIELDDRARTICVVMLILSRSMDRRYKRSDAKQQINTSFEVDSFSISVQRGLIKDHVWFEYRWMVASLCDE
jgi:hypothetical protein